MTDGDISAHPVQAEYKTLASLRDAHLTLKNSSGAAAPGNLTGSSVAEGIRAFLSRARRAGRFLSEPKERRSAQGILDYWSAELAALPGVASEDFAVVLLDPFDPGQPRGDDQSRAPDRSGERELIFLSASARQWQASGKDSGYLLKGNAIKQAARYRALDAGIEELVRASEEAAEARIRTRRLIAIAATFGALICGIGVYLWKSYYLPWAGRDHVARLTATDTDQIKSLVWLSRRQSWLPPYDLSAIKPLHNSTLLDFELAAPNFATVSFAGVSWRKAKLKSASFNDTKFSFDGGVSQNDLGEADLQNAQFRNAKIAFTSFRGANLYRAVFDRSLFCKVDFSGANLSLASFWAATLDKETESTLKDTAWWLARGWPWSEIQKLAPPRRVDASPLDAVEQNKSRVAHLKETKGFEREINDKIERLDNTPKDTVERALALNDVAWTRAVWGIDIDVKNEPPLGSCSAEDTPIGARQAAEQAVCIVGKLNSQGALLANLRDTLAYILMQSDQSDHMTRALEELKKASQDDPKFLNSGEHLFRYAIAQYASSSDKTEALKNFQTAIDQKGYEPTHELQNLKDYIFIVEDFVDTLKSSLKRRWPVTEGTMQGSSKTPCPVPQSATAR